MRPALSSVPGARDLEFGHGVARFAPAGDGIKDIFTEAEAI
jgi:hypothetical protein